MNPAEIIRKLVDGQTPEIPELAALLSLPQGPELDELFRAAYAVKKKYVGTKVHLRGIVEFSNICTKNCFYCGIRRGNRKVHRYTLSEDAILEQALFADRAGFGSCVLQSGERSDPEFTEFVERVIRRIKKESEGRLGITLSLGEQSAETYRRWFAAGAHRYLLRIEAANPELYRKLHPQDHSWENRKNCLSELKKAGFQLGTGTMSGLPFQTPENLAEDILFFRETDSDMIGMGPYIVHDDTPLAAEMPDFDPVRQLETGLKMIAVTRLVLKDVNIAATTALQALHPQGRIKGLLAGANVIMPNVTETDRRADYLLYRNKPGISDSADSALEKLQREIADAGEEIEWNSWGDSPHAKKIGGTCRA